MTSIPYFRPSIGEAEKQAVLAVLSSGWLTTGQAVRQFEARFAEYVGAPEAVAVNSCTAALHLGLEANGVRQDDVVLVPAMTFAATAAAVRYLGGRPALVDCDPQTLCMDPQAAAEAARQWSAQGRLRGIVPVHYGGQMADLDRLTELAARHGMFVLEDAAHALPSYTRRGPEAPWRPAGSISPVTCFSFYANKCITTGEGGMVAVHDPERAARIRMMSLHGLSKSAWRRFEAGASWYYEILEPGFKYNMTDVAAAIGLAQLERADELCRRRQAVARHYTERLSAWADFVQTPVELPDRRSSWHIYPVQLRLEELDIDRNAFLAELGQRGVTCSVHWMPLHLHPYYERTYGYRPEDFPHASAAWPRLISLPLFPDLTESEVEYVCDAMAALFRQHAATGRLVAAGG